MLFVSKKDEKLRFFVDYIKLNKIAVKDTDAFPAWMSSSIHSEKPNVSQPWSSTPGIGR